MTIYLAARYGRYPEMQAVARALTARGHTVTARWIWGLHAVHDAAVGTGTLGALEARFAQADMADLRAADCVIAFSEPALAFSRGGRHVELGMALAWGKRCIVVGGHEHVFHALPQVEHVADLAALSCKLDAKETAV